MKTFIKGLIRESLLSEITSQEAWDKHYSDVNKFPALKGDKELFDKLDALYPKKGNQHNRGYFMWLYKMYRNGLKDEDFYKVKEYLDLFFKYINMIPKDKRDITQYQTIQDLLDVVKQYRDAEASGDEMATSKTDEKKKRLAKESKLVYKSDKWKVSIPLTEWASCELGQNTEWCTAAKQSRNMFNHYNSDGPLYIMLDLDENERYQLHFESNQLMDENDRPIPAAYFFDHVAEDYGLYDFLKGQSEKFYEFILTTSVEDMADGGYSETFEEALNSVNKDSYDYKQALRVLRNGRDSYSIYLGFIYEDNPDNIEDYEITELFEKHMDEKDLTRIFEHLNSIGFDLEEAGYDRYKAIIDDLEAAGFSTNTTYGIDKGRQLRITGYSFDNEDKPYKVTLTDSNGKNKSGNLGIDSLKNLRYNMSLFEGKKK